MTPTATVLQEQGYNSGLAAAGSPNVLDQILDPIIEAFTPEVARRIAAITLDAKTQVAQRRIGGEGKHGSIDSD